MASKRAQRRRSCERKKRYESRKDAAHDALALARKQHESIHAYRCRNCGGWHVGHTPKRVLQAIRARQEAARA